LATAVRWIRKVGPSTAGFRLRGSLDHPEFDGDLFIRRFSSKRSRNRGREIYRTGDRIVVVRSLKLRVMEGLELGGRQIVEA